MWDVFSSRSGGRSARVAKPKARPVLEGLEGRKLFSTGYALLGNAGTVLARFDTSNPTAILSTKTVGNLPAGVELRGIDFRPATGELYALGTRAAAGNDEGLLFKLNLSTGDATQVGPGAFTTVLASDEPYGFDFNPATDRIRVFNGEDQNFRINPNTGVLVQFDTPLANAIDGETVTGAAYDRNVNDVQPAGSPAKPTTLYGIDYDTDALVRIGGIDGGAPEGSPNDGVVTGIGALGVVAGSPSNGFDIAQDGTAYALIRNAVTGATGLYTINLATGDATGVAPFNNGQEVIRGFAIAPDDLPAKANADTYLVSAGITTVVLPSGVLSNDTDPDGPDDALTAELITNPANGTLAFNADGGFTYTPNAGFVGQDVFTYVANDGTQDSQPVAVTLNVVPTVSINDKAITEGNNGSKFLTFTVTLSAPAPAGGVFVNYKTQNNTAGEGDYGVTNGGLNFGPGETSKTFDILIKGDTKSESDETFYVKLTGATNASLADSSGVGTILNDDDAAAPQQPQPAGNSKVFIGDASITEGKNGTKNLMFNVSLDAVSAKTVTMKYTTQNQTAGEGDYQVKSGTLTFSPGQLSKTITIAIKGDSKVEANEQFRVNLTNIVNALAGDSQGLGTILNDD